MKKIRFKFNKINWKEIFNYFVSVVISASILALVLISLPLTEKVSSSASYDLVNKNSMYWSKEYILELNTSQSSNIQKDTANLKSVLQKRLRNFDVEQSSITSYQEDDKYYLKVEIQTSKEQELVEQLIKNPFIINIVTKKDDVNYEDTENPLIPYLEENYNKTEFTRKDFRTIYITKLKNTSGEYSYFGIFKAWPLSSKWNEFLNKYIGQTVGVSIDGFVTPVQINEDKIFAPSVSAIDEQYAKVTSILYNSGVSPMSYSTIKEEEKPLNIAEVDYIKLTEGILIAILFIYVYLLVVEKTRKSIILKSGVATVLTVSSWITYLKLSATPVDIFILALEVIVVAAIIRMIAENIDSRVHITLLLTFTSLLCILLGFGYVKIFANDLLILIILSNLSLL
ncbi:MAG TPA: hypothetical protein PLW18_02760, partial [Candidatus Dojkabacteria bacterium]|nr:hypothetical protein [Candidatus Dojkabacteria bacterium]